MSTAGSATHEVRPGSALIKSRFRTLRRFFAVCLPSARNIHETDRPGMTYLESLRAYPFHVYRALRSLHRPQMHAHLRTMQAANIIDLIRKHAELHPDPVAFAVGASI